MHKPLSLTLLLAAAALVISPLAQAGPPTIDPTYAADIQAPGSGAGAPNWIWAGQGGAKSADLSKSFTLIDPPNWTSLVVAAHGLFHVRINGVAAGDCAQVDQVCTFDIAKLLKRGRNVIDMQAQGGGVAVWLQIPGMPAIVSDSTWNAGGVYARIVAGGTVSGWPVALSARKTDSVWWVWASKTTDNQNIYLRKTFTIASVPPKAILSATTDDRFTAFVNGKQAASGAGWTVVQNVDVTSLLHAGLNTIAIRGHNDIASAGALAQIASGDDILVDTDPSWRVSMDDPPASEWAQPGFDDSAWPRVSPSGTLMSDRVRSPSSLKGWPGLTSGHAPYLEDKTLPVVAVVSVHAGAGGISGADGLSAGSELVATPPSADSTDLPGVLLDFGKELNGRVNVTSSTGAVLTVGTGESAEEAQQKPFVHADLALNPGVPNATKITGARYAYIAFPPNAALTSEKLGVTFDHVYYPVTYRGGFDCSDPALTQYWYTGAYTAHLCMQDDIWDGVKRDRGLWSGDYEVSGESIAAAFGDRFLTERSLWRLSVDPQKVKHHINAIPGYSASWICNVASLYRHNGDLDFLSSLHDSLLGLTAYMKADLDSDLLFQNLHPVADTPIMMYCDWCKGVGPNDDNAESRAITDLYYIQAYREAAYLLAQMGDSQNAANCEKLASDMTSSACRAYLSASGTYGERIQENTRAILAGVASPEQLRGIFANVFAPGSPGRVKPASSALPRTITPYYLGFIFPVLSILGHNDEAIALARTYCGGMLARGATTYWETFDPESRHDLGFGGSRCHAWSSGITSWLTEYVVGVRSTVAGFKTVEIAPNLTGLAWVSGDVPTPHGTIHVHASQSAGKMNVFIDLPKGITAHVGLPGKAVRIDGKAMPGEPGPGGRRFVSLGAAGEYLLSGE